MNKTKYFDILTKELDIIKAKYPENIYLETSIYGDEYTINLQGGRIICDYSYISKSYGDFDKFKTVKGIKGLLGVYSEEIYTTLDFDEDTFKKMSNSSEYSDDFIFDSSMRGGLTQYKEWVNGLMQVIYGVVMKFNTPEVLEVNKKLKVINKKYADVDKDSPEFDVLYDIRYDLMRKYKELTK